MYFLKSAVSICAILVVAEAVKLPNYFKQCKKDDSNLSACLKQSATAGVSEFVKGDPEHHVMKLNPLHVNEMLIDVNGNLKIKLTDFDVHGLEGIQIEKLDWDFEKKRLDLVAKFDKTTLLGTYDINGKILILPITGNGPCNITYINPVHKYHFEYDLQEKNNKEYVNIVKSGLTYTLDRAYFGLENLFNGDKRLGDEMTKFLDENWKEVNEEIGAKVGDGIGEVISGVLKNFFAAVPLNDLFA